MINEIQASPSYNLKESNQKFDVEETVIDTKELIEKIIPKECPTSLIPHTLISYLASNHMDTFISSFTKTAGFKSDCCSTSCINTVNALISLFIGPKRAQPLVKHRLLRKTPISVAITLPTQDTLNYTITGLFEGIVTTKLNKISDFDLLDGDEKRKIEAKYYNFYFNDFFGYFDQLIFHNIKSETVTKIFNKIDYDFNSKTCTALKKELIDNQEKVDLDTSYIYTIVVSAPTEDDVRLHDFEHAFILEQFFCSETKSPIFHFYQSWISQATLYDDMQKRSPLTLNQALEFLDTVESLYSGKSEITSKQCFGYHDNDQTNRIIFDSEQKILTGLSIRYFSHAIDPNQCMKNLEDLVNSDNELKVQVFKHLVDQ